MRASGTHRTPPATSLTTAVLACLPSYDGPARAGARVAAVEDQRASAAQLPAGNAAGHRDGGSGLREARSVSKPAAWAEDDGSQGWAAGAAEGGSGASSPLGARRSGGTEAPGAWQPALAAAWGHSREGAFDLSHALLLRKTPHPTCLHVLCNFIAARCLSARARARHARLASCTRKRPPPYPHVTPPPCPAAPPPRNAPAAPA